MVHIYKDELDEIDMKLITNEHIKVKDSRIATYQFRVLVCFSSFMVYA